MSCTASRLMMAAFAAYLLGSLSNDAVVTWVVVALAVAAVLAWSRRRGSGGRALGRCGVRCATQRRPNVDVAPFDLVDTSPGLSGRPAIDPFHVKEEVL